MEKRTSGKIDPPRAVAYLTPMSKMPIVTIPDPLLRQKSVPVERVDPELDRLIDDMLETMYVAPGIGLAAVQVGVPRRLIVIDVADHEKEGRQPIAMINPEILELGSEFVPYEEGCLSIPDIKVEIERPSSLRVRFTDRLGQQQEMQAQGLMATVIQHEVDHLDGRLIIDFLSRLKRDMIIRKFRKMAKTESA